MQVSVLAQPTVAPGASETNYVPRGSGCRRGSAANCRYGAGHGDQREGRSRQRPRRRQRSREPEAIDPVEDRILATGRPTKATKAPGEVRIVDHEDALRVLPLAPDPDPERLPLFVMFPPQIATASLTRKTQSRRRARGSPPPRPAIAPPSQADARRRGPSNPSGQSSFTSSRASAIFAKPARCSETSGPARDRQ